jgi:hypothetical protein
MRARPYDTDEKEHTATTVLEINHYNNLDNKRVWNKFKPLIIDGAGWPFIKSYENATNSREVLDYVDTGVGSSNTVPAHSCLLE